MEFSFIDNSVKLFFKHWILHKLIIDGDKDMLKIFNSMGISTTHIKELKTMLKGAPMIKEEGVYGFEPSFIKGNSSLQLERNERLKNIMIARMNETITKICLVHSAENQVLQLRYDWHNWRSTRLYLSGYCKK
jgi:hypothetical protein